MKTDHNKSVRHVTDIPCARNSLLGGIASGVGIGVVRGMSSSTFFFSFEIYIYTLSSKFFREGPIVAGNWAMATFVAVSLGSLCVFRCWRKLTQTLFSFLFFQSFMPEADGKRAEENDDYH